MHEQLPPLLTFVDTRHLQASAHALSAYVTRESSHEKGSGAYLATLESLVRRATNEVKTGQRAYYSRSELDELEQVALSMVRSAADRMTVSDIAADAHAEAQRHGEIGNAVLRISGLLRQRLSQIV